MARAGQPEDQPLLLAGLRPVEEPVPAEGPLLEEQQRLADRLVLREGNCPLSSKWTSTWLFHRN